MVTCIRLKNLSSDEGSDHLNIARGTTDPGYLLFNLSYLSS